MRVSTNPAVISETLLNVDLFRCNDDWTAGVGATVGSDSSITYTCELGTTTTIAVSTGTPSSSAAPVSSKSRRDSKCEHGGNPDSSCFNELDLPDFIMNW